LNWLNFFETKTPLRHSFGRCINAKLAPNEEELFNKSYEAFETQNILDAYEHFFKSLENFSDKKSNQNVLISREQERLNFTIFQGSAKITGHVTKEQLYAESTLCKSPSAHVALKRYILERNYQLTYANYFSDDEYIKLKLHHDNSTITPQKIFFPLREIALNADFDKEYVKTEFCDIKLEDIEHLLPIDEKELEIKFSAQRGWIEEATSKIVTLPSNDNSGMQAFIYLYLLFKIDYLLVPRYEIHQKMSKKIQHYYGDEGSTIESKNEELKEYVEKLQEMDFTKFKTQFYNAQYTFNPTDKTPNEEISIFIDESLKKIRWYKNNRYNQIIPTIYSYITFYILYNYGLHPVVKELLHTLVEIQNPQFFKALEYNLLYDETNQSFSKRAIVSRIEHIIEPHQEQFKLLEPFGAELNYETLNEFSHSFYLNITALNFEEV
jgi:hypothetical protein